MLATQSHTNTLKIRENEKAFAILRILAAQRKTGAARSREKTFAAHSTQ